MKHLHLTLHSKFFSGDTTFDHWGITTILQWLSIRCHWDTCLKMTNQQWSPLIPFWHPRLRTGSCVGLEYKTIPPEPATHKHTLTNLSNRGREKNLDLLKKKRKIILYNDDLKPQGASGWQREEDSDADVRQTERPPTINHFTTICDVFKNGQSLLNPRVFL